VGKGTAQYQRTPAIDELREFLAAKDKSAAGPRKVCGCSRDDVRVRDGVVVAGMHLARDQPREVRHVDHERGTDLIRDLPHTRKFTSRGYEL